MLKLYSAFVASVSKFAVVATCLAAGPVLADYPDKPVRMIVPFAPGGATDVVARSLAQRLSQMWNQPVFVENKPGAGGNIGADTVAKSTPDGYTILLASPAEIVINPHLFAHMPYDAAKDLVAVTKIAAAPLVLVVNATIPGAYTSAELSFAALKGADAAAAGVLASAAQDAACDLHVALLRIEESGAAEHTGYSGSRHYRRYRDHDDDDHEDSDSGDEFEVGEIFDRFLTLAHWSRPDGHVEALGTWPFTDAELCPGDALQDMDPDEQHFEEATGNEGASFERSYQRAALVLWPHSRRLAVLTRAGFDASLPYLADLAERWARAGAEQGDAHWRDAHALVGQMLG